jgi:hypothetical protein
LSTVITAAKKMYFDKLILKSVNKTKTTRNIVKSITNNGNTTNNIATMDINKKPITNPLTIANASNTYFTTVAEKLTNNSFTKSSIKREDPLIYLRENFRQPISEIRLHNTTTHEINNIIHTLKCKDSHGYDEISTRILKISTPYILFYI